MEDLELIDLGEDSIPILWKDRSRVLGIPIGLKSYKLTNDRLFIESGILNIEEEQVLLYRVQDLHLRMALWQRPFNIGTVCVYSTDKTSSMICLENIKHPRKVKELIHRQVEDARLRRKMRLMDIIHMEHMDGEGPDGLEAEDSPEESVSSHDRHDLHDIHEELEELDGNLV